MAIVADYFFITDCWIILNFQENIFLSIYWLILVQVYCFDSFGVEINLFHLTKKITASHDGYLQQVTIVNEECTLYSAKSY